MAYTDGACIPNPGPGGFGVVLLYKGHRKELARGYRQTTNNRMEILAAITALEALREPCSVKVFSDSEYLVNGVRMGWAKKWKEKGWRNGNGSARNPDLWDRLLKLCEAHTVEFIWVRAHSGLAENERCDWLASQSARSNARIADEGYEASTSSAA